MQASRLVSKIKTYSVEENSMTYIELLNQLFAAHRDGDVVQKYIILQELEEVEPAFADTLDLMNY
jgi:hypothetical protein